jgi:hypothetical protein
VRAAQFRSTWAPDKYAILHPSSKKPGKWQLSYFDELGPWGDSGLHDTCSAALAEMEHPRDWKLEKVTPAPASRLAGAAGRRKRR